MTNIYDYFFIRKAILLPKKMNPKLCYFYHHKTNAKKGLLIKSTNKIGHKRVGKSICITLDRLQFILMLCKTAD